VEHPLLGVEVQTQPDGVEIAKVQAGTGAASAGLKAGDVITAVDGKTVKTAQGLRAAIAAHAPGDKLSLTILRNAATTTVTVTLGSRS
jgi:S1-C subfamily serine protease